MKARGKPGNGGPAVSAFSYPEPPLEGFTQVMLFPFQKQTPRPGRDAWGFFTDYFGASSVASALDLRTGRDPGANHLHTNITFRPATHHQDISIWPVTGHFYLASTDQFSSTSCMMPSQQRAWLLKP